MLDYAEICRKLQNVRKCAENNKLCGNVRRTVNCAIPHPSHLIGASEGTASGVTHSHHNYNLRPLIVETAVLGVVHILRNQLRGGGGGFQMITLV